MLLYEKAAHKMLVQLTLALTPRGAQTHLPVRCMIWRHLPALIAKHKKIDRNVKIFKYLSIDYISRLFQLVVVVVKSVLKYLHLLLCLLEVLKITLP